MSEVELVDGYPVDRATRPADAGVILRQIGGNALADLGARNFLSIGDGLQMQVGHGSLLRKVLVKLAADDTYIVQAVKFNRRTFAMTWTYDITDVYSEALAQVVRVAAQTVGVAA